MRELSLRGKRSTTADGAGGEVWVTLFEATHPDLEAPVRLSSDPTERITTDPLVYGTRHQGDTFLFALSGAMLPDEEEEAPPTITLTVEVPGPETIELMRSFLDPAAVTIKLVLASTPDVIEDEYFDLELADWTVRDGVLQLVCAPIDYASEPCPPLRMTVERFPGLRRQ